MSTCSKCGKTIPIGEVYDFFDADTLSVVKGVCRPCALRMTGGRGSLEVKSKKRKQETSKTKKWWQFWRHRRTRTEREQQPAQDATQSRDAANLLSEITNHVSIIPGDTSQEDRIAKLVSLGPGVIPEIESAVWSIIRYVDYIPKFENGGLLCEAIGKIGGDTAFDILRQFATQESNIVEYRYLRAGAARGLAYLAVSDNRATDILQDIGNRYGIGETIASVLEQLGVQPIETWDTIAKYTYAQVRS